jgi:hypothetical protein
MSKEFKGTGYQNYHSLISPLIKEIGVITERVGKINSWMTVDERSYISLKFHLVQKQTKKN